MKKRIQIDTTILILTIIIFIALFFKPGFYAGQAIVEDLFDFLGVTFLIKGTFLRMSARGHKKAHSQKSDSLVTSGPYSLIRNPMYIGSFLIGSGFVFVIGPWWFWPMFALMFYLRFRIQIAKEEKFLLDMFGEKYAVYCQRVPQLFPKVRDIFRVRIRDVFNPQEAFSTKEIHGLWAWPILAYTLDLIKERIALGHVEPLHTLAIFMLAIVIIVGGSWIEYQLRK